MTSIVLPQALGACVFGTGEGITIIGRGCLSRGTGGLVHAFEFRPHRVERSEFLWFNVPLLVGLGEQRHAARLIGRVSHALDYREREGFAGAAIAIAEEAATRIGFNQVIRQVEALHAGFQRASIDPKTAVVTLAAPPEMARVPVYDEATLLHIEANPLRIRLPNAWQAYLSREQLFGLIRQHGDFSQAETRGYILRESTVAPADFILEVDFLSGWNEALTGKNVWLEQRNAALAAQQEAEQRLAQAEHRLEAARAAIAEIEHRRVNAEKVAQAADTNINKLEQQLEAANAAARAVDDARREAKLFRDKAVALERERDNYAGAARKLEEIQAKYNQKVKDHEKYLRDVKVAHAKEIDGLTTRIQDLQSGGGRQRQSDDDPTVIRRSGKPGRSPLGILTFLLAFGGITLIVVGLVGAIIPGEVPQLSGWTGAKESKLRAELKAANGELAQKRQLLVQATQERDHFKALSGRNSDVIAELANNLKETRGLLNVARGGANDRERDLINQARAHENQIADLMAELRATREKLAVAIKTQKPPEPQSVGQSPSAQSEKTDEPRSPSTAHDKVALCGIDDKALQFLDEAESKCLSRWDQVCTSAGRLREIRDKILACDSNFRCKTKALFDRFRWPVGMIDKEQSGALAGMKAAIDCLRKD